MTEHRSGFVAVIGRPNVGKSTLINALLNQKIAAVSARPQTTRRKQLGILTLPNAQLIFTDTPGIHKPVTTLGSYMNEAALDTIRDCDVLLWLVDSSVEPQPEDLLVADHMRKAHKEKKAILALNKIDAIPSEGIEQRKNQYSRLVPEAQVVLISAKQRIGFDELKQAITGRLPEAPLLYDENVITDLFEREIAADLIREAALKILRDEIPHCMAVRVDEYKERNEQLVYVLATLLVEKESHKGIVIGKNGEMLKQIGQSARQQIETMSEKKVYLELKVKLSKNWRDNPRMLQALGYIMSSGS